MRAGLLDRIITLECAVSTTLNDAGTPSGEWYPYASPRAQRVQSSTSEFIRAFGASSESVMVFRIRYFPGVQVSNRVIFEGQAFDLIEIVEIGRRVELELRCKRIGKPDARQ